MSEPADAGPAGTSPAGTSPAEPDPPEVSPRRRRRWWRPLVETVAVVLVAVVLAGLVRTYVFQTFYIPTSSMVPTLGVYDRILVQKAFFTWHDVRDGDIVVFSHPPLDDCPGPDNGDLVKRVIALPGQTIYSSGGSIYVNGRLLSEPYLPRYDPLGPPIPDATRQHPYRVPAGDFYVLGDNRAISCDSRYWGPIKGSSIVGKAILVWWANSHPVFRRV
ncbi:MAG TPA: signal peptidase I [Streptosporangiaceae bacterium]